MPLDPAAEPDHDGSQGHQQHNGQDHAHGMHGGHDIGLANVLLVQAGAVAYRGVGEDGRASGPVRLGHVHVEGAVLDMEFKTLGGVVAREALDGAQGVDPLLGG